MNSVDDTTLLELPDLILPELNKERKTNDDFMVDLIAVANEVNKAIVIVSGIIEQKTIDAEKMNVVRGHVVRMYKLYDSYMFLIVNRRTEIAFQILRALSETIIHLQYLLKYVETDIHKKYMRVSLAYEKRLENSILNNVRDREEKLPIEKRMLSSIKNTFLRSGMENLENHELTKTKWGVKKQDLDISGKAKDMGLYGIYESIFTVSSSFVHGNWHELDFHHLERKDDVKQIRPPQMHYTNPKPQLLEAISIIVVETLQKYISTITNEGECRDAVLTHLSTISDWYSKMIDKHEECLESDR